MEHWKQSFHCSFSLTGQHPIQQRVTPVELLMERKLQTNLEKLKPSTSTTVLLRQHHQKFHHDRTTKMRMFHKGKEVFAQNLNNSPGWLTGNILEGIDALSFLIRLQDGRVIRRHQDHVRPPPCSSDPMSPTPGTRVK